MRCVELRAVASAISHALIGAAIGLLATRDSAGDASSGADTAIQKAGGFRALRWLALATAVLPDADVLMHAHVSASDPFGHRGAFHSLAFYAVVAGALSLLPILRHVRARAALCLFAAMSSHSLLDMLTDGGLGILLGWPFFDTRHFFAWRPIPVSPLAITEFLGPRGLQILRAELPMVLPAFVAAWLWFDRGKASPGAAANSTGQRPSAEDSGAEDADDTQQEALPDDLAVLEITDAIDLHGFAPRDILDVVDAYLEAAQEKGFTEVRLIHGRGKGVQRVRVQKLLRSHPLVLRYQDAPPTRGGWGATIAWLKTNSDV